MADTGGDSLAFQSSFDRALGNPVQYSCLENPHGHRGLVGCSPRGHKESGMTEASKHTWDKTQGQGLPSPLQNHSGSSSITQCPLHCPPPLDRPQHRMETRGWGVQEEPPLTTASPFQARPSPETPTGPVSEGHAHTLVCNNNDNLFS